VYAYYGHNVSKSVCVDR